MSFIGSLGSFPVGELYYSPPNKEGDSWLMGQYYAGGSVKLIKFQKPKESPEEGSPLHRIETLEDDHLYNAKILFDIVKFIKGAHGPDFGEDELKAHIAAKEAFIATRTEFYNTESPYLVANVELMQKDRGWSG